MKQILRTGTLAAVVFLLFTCFKGNSQSLLTENFDYVNGTLLTAAGWASHSGTGTQAVDVIVPGLTFSGYPLSNIGGAAQIDNNGEDLNRKFTVQTSGKVYAAFLVKVNGAADGYFLHLGGDPISTIFRGKVFISGTADPFNFGVSVGSNTGTTLTGGAFNYGKTYLMVLKYEIVDGEKNDIVSLFISDTSVPSTEPATPSIGPLTDNSQTDIQPGTIALRQFSASQSILVDGIRIANTWGGAVTAALAGDTSAPVFANGFPRMANITSTKADLEVTMDEAGKAWYIVVPDNAATPTAAQVFAGLNYGSVTLVSHGTIDVTAGGTAYAANISGLTDKTDYDVYVIAQDDETTPNKQTTPVKIDLYTINPPAVLKSVDFTSSLAPFTQVSITGDQLWNKAEYSGNSYAYINGYSGGNKENSDWLISPAINLDTATTVKASFKTAKNYTGPALKVMISSNFNGTFSATGINAATWTDITSNFEYSGGSFAWKSSGEFALSAYSGKVCIAFVYESTTDGAAAWEVDDFLVTGYLKNTGINQLAENDITLFPVPAKDQIHFGNLNGVHQIEIYDGQGRMMLQRNIPGQNQITLNISNLPGGIYLVRFNTSGIPVVKKFIKEAF